MGVASSVDGLIKLNFQFFCFLFNNSPEDLLFALKVVIDGAFALVGGSSNLLHGGLPETIPCKDLAGHFHNMCPESLL